MNEPVNEELVCQVEGCRRPVEILKWGLCRTHYARQLRGRSPGSPVIAPRRRRPKVCSVDGCGKQRVARGFCDRHYRQHRRSLAQSETTARKAGKGDDVSYAGAHGRLHRSRGSAHRKVCSRCSQPATRWRLRSDAEKVRTDPVSGLTYSPDPSDYEPLCAPCDRGEKPRPHVQQLELPMQGDD